MNFEYTDSPGGDLIINLQGEMDALGCTEIRPSLERIVNTENNHDVILDMGSVSFLDSSGIGVIVFLYKRLKARGRALEIINVQGQPRDLMELLRIDSAIPVSVGSGVNPPPGSRQCAG